jgi:hypothetical protein
MKLHRYKTFSNDIDSCQEGFGGPARCALPRLADVHYSDTYHPLTRVYPDDQRCSWRNQGGPGHCGREARDPAHDVGQVRPPDEDYAPNPRPYLPRPGAYVEPPTERLPVLNMVDLAEDAAKIQMHFEEASSPAEEKSAPAWERVVAALRERKELTSGPWPVRLYDLSAPGAWRPYMDLLGALGRLHEAYTAGVWWLDDRRWAWVTWSYLDGMSVDYCAEEIARRARVDKDYPPDHVFGR